MVLLPICLIIRCGRREHIPLGGFRSWRANLIISKWYSKLSRYWKLAKPLYPLSYFSGEVKISSGIKRGFSTFFMEDIKHAFYQFKNRDGFTQKKVKRVWWRSMIWTKNHLYVPIDWSEISQMIHLLRCMALKGMDVTGTNPIKSWYGYLKLSN